MEHNRQQRADAAILAFRTQVRLLASAVASLRAGLDRVTVVKAEGPETVDLGALADRLENVRPMLVLLTEQVREKAVGTFGKASQGDETVRATIHGVRNSLHAVVIAVHLLQAQLKELEAADDSAKRALSEEDLGILDAEVQEVARELATWSREIGAGINR
jgi:hypothetical protein